MPITALPQLAPTWYTPASQAEDEKPTRFRIRPLTGVEYLHIKPHIHVDLRKSEVTIGPEGIELAFEKGLEGWENLHDENGNEINFTQKTKRERIPSELVSEIGWEIILASSAQENQKKT